MPHRHTIKKCHTGISYSKNMTTKQLIREYVDDHYNNFGFYPYDVEVDGQVYSYGGYWAILEDRRFD